MQAGEGGTSMLDLVNEQYYACKYDNCEFVVHDECYGGIPQARIKAEDDNFVYEQMRQFEMKE